MEVIKSPKIQDWKQLCKRPVFEKEQLDNVVTTILTEVKDKEDRALLNYAKLFDKVNLSTLSVSEKEIEAANNLVSTDLKAAIYVAKQNIEKFHAAQKI
ncbi:MAG: histidinol dehydrogenase, partial [Flavobacteriales bacterium]|nr:histidinol dehydrogenase [Flavobacteriales bacterium]